MEIGQSAITQDWGSNGRNRLSRSPVWFAGEDGSEDHLDVEVKLLSQQSEVVGPPTYKGLPKYVPPPVVDK